MNPQPGYRDETGLNIMLTLLLGVFGIAALLWVAAGVSALLSGNPWPDGDPLDALGTVAHPGNPSNAWHTPVGPAMLYWPVVAVLVVTSACLARLVWRGFRGNRSGQPTGDPMGRPGMAARREIRTAAGRKALLRRARQLRPSLQDPTAPDVGFRLGRSRGVNCWSSVEDSMILLGPPRSGKGLHTVISMILDAPGAVVATSTRPDNLTATLDARRADGRPVAVFDPQHLAPGIPAAIRWSPIRGCDDPQTAMIRAKALCIDDGKGVENGTFWTQQCYTAVRCLLHAAALGKRPPVELYQWSLSPIAAKDAVEILKTHPRSAQAWSRALDGIVTADPRQRDSVWAMVANTFAALADPAVLACVSPSEREHFDPVTFLRTRGTLYLLGTAAGASATAGLVAAFVEDVVEAARRLAAASPGARLDPPLTLILDEAANYPLPSLPSLMSEGGGTGITTLTVLQSLSQARDKWGHDGAGAIWDAAIVKIILGGGGNADDLRDLSALIGTRRELRTSVSYGAASGRQWSESVEDRPILEPGQLRVLKFGTGLLLLRTAPPIVMRMTQWVDRPDGRRLAASRAAREQDILQANNLQVARHA